MNLPKELTTVTKLSKLLAAILFIALPFLGFFLGLRYQETMDLANRQQIEHNLAVSHYSTPAPDETVNWKTYRSEEFGFEFKYPTIYKTLDYCQPELLRLDNRTPSFTLGPIGLYIEDSKGLTLSEYVDRALELEKSKRPQDRPYVLKSRTTTTLGGREAIQVVANWCGAGCNEPHTVYVEKEQKIYRFLFDDGILNHCPIKTNELPSETANQILSTFRFTDGQGNNQQLGDAATKEECLAKGGSWQKWGLAQLEYCQIPSQDAGKSCTDNSQCTYKCISTSEVSGKCATYKNTYGCFSIVENGKAQQTLCAD